MSGIAGNSLFIKRLEVFDQLNENYGLTMSSFAWFDPQKYYCTIDIVVFSNYTILYLL